MIRVSIGKVGSGKTACEVREMATNRTKRIYYSNIETSIKSNITLKPEMIIKKELVETKTKKDGTITPVYDYKLNVEFWKDRRKQSISVIVDEAHSVLNSRKSMSKQSIILGDFLALIRRFLGEDESGAGELVLITQLPYKIDVVARDLATEWRHHICYYKKTCLNCGCYWVENSEMPDRLFTCPKCRGVKLKKHNHFIVVRCFESLPDYESWNLFGNKTYFKQYIVNDIEKYFPLYDTLQWDNMFSTIY